MRVRLHGEMKRMRAVYYLSLGQVGLKETAEPVPQKGEGLVKVHYAGICGSDLTIVSGKHLTAQPPLILGHEFSGELVQINEDDSPSTLRVGDRVTVFPLLSCHRCLTCRSGDEHICRELGLIGVNQDGGMAEYARVPLRSLIKLEPQTDLRLAALNEPLAVAIHSVRESRLSLGDHVLISGGGPIGTLLALVLRYCGISQLVICEIHPYRKRLLKELGFAVLDPIEEDVAQSVLSRTDQEGVDIVFEASGAEGATLNMTECVRPRGQILVVSVFKKPVPIDLRKVAYKEINLKGIRVYRRLDFERATKLVGSSQLPLDKVISCEFPLARAVEGFHLLQNHGDAVKVLIHCI